MPHRSLCTPQSPTGVDVANGDVAEVDVDITALAKGTIDVELSNSVELEAGTELLRESTEDEEVAEDWISKLVVIDLAAKQDL
ncbi:hypothetical protein HBI24_239370 [Parastagonospora nodorum]|nr:hypothetical protein HBI28_235580 [Parastagonospora nodorum]KAH5565559.1 hypothetical protein HBI24_239370 [Parastagonospora nodorum]KAH5620835.1 hypothetical protein HBI22_203710 [Parastagonospora nodorum]KAH5665074.1 hypothetical protein HBI44_227990 [Parastagonospora nodorum]KAH5666487.1 hypothetical protein HBI21_232710 [Parastagonospora nodorum]